LFVLLILVVVTLVALARPLQALAGFLLVGIGLPVYRIFAARALGARTPNGEIT
jgi:hypothetical protein